MNSLEMYQSVLQNADIIAAFSTDQLETYEAAGILNKMQLRFCKSRFYMVSNDKQRGFEQTQKRLADLHTLICEETYNSTPTFPSGIGNPVVIDIPSDFLFMINASVTIKNLGFVKEDVPIEIMEQEFVYQLLQNPFAQPKKLSPKGVVQDYALKVYVSKMSILNACKITYLRYPTPIEVYLPLTPGGDPPDTLKNCELPEHTHDEIVDMAVKHILENISSPRYQSNSFELKQTE